MTLYNAVNYLAEKTHAFTDEQLAYGWAWHFHAEGIRFALIGTYHELRDLAVRLAQARQQPLPPAQHLLSQYHAAYRDWQAVLLGLSDEDFDRTPAPGEWSIRQIMTHVVGGNRAFFSLVAYGVARQQSDPPLSTELPADETERLFGPYADYKTMMETARPGTCHDYYHTLHHRTLTQFAHIPDSYLHGQSLWWEGQEVSLHWRLHRFDAHLRQHTIQAEKARDLLNLPTTEAHRYLRLIYNALAEVESLLLANGDLLAAEQTDLAHRITSRADEVAHIVTHTPAFIEAVKAGDAAHVESQLAAYPAFNRALDEQGLSLIMTAAYRQQFAIAETLIAAGAETTVLEGAALGKMDIVVAELIRYPEDTAYTGRDGFTPLHLACYFGHPDIAQYLIEKGANVNTPAQNTTQLTPLHAATASNSTPIVQMLLDNGAEACATQTGGITPFHTAASRDNTAIMQALLTHGADPNALTDNNQSALDIATAREKTNAIAFLQSLV